MTRTGLAVTLAVLISVPVPGLAQEKKPPATKAQPTAAKPADKPAAATVKPAGKPAAKPAVAKVEKAAPQPSAKPASETRRRSRAHEDARSCLQHTTDLEIRKCAENYR